VGTKGRITQPSRILAIVLGVSLAAWNTVAQNTDAQWDFRFGRPALDDGALTAAWWQGELYVGGNFTTAGHSYAPGVARWDGTNFWPVGEGLTTDLLGTPPVTTLAVFDNALYAGGYFTRSGTNALAGLARWDGTNWSAVPGAGGQVNQLLVHGNALFAAGNLQFPGDTNRYAVARWDGVAWETFGSRISSWAAATQIAVRGDEVFISGSFTTLAGQALPYNAHWDGSTWSALPGLTNQTFRALAIHQGELYGSGSFTSIGGTAATNLARWDGTNWWPVGGGFDQPPDHLLSTGAELLAAGRFKKIGDVPVDGVARWDGQQWQPLGLDTWSGNQGPGWLCLGASNRLFVVGYFTQVAGQRAGHVAEWTGNAWRPLVAEPSLALSDGVVLLMALAASDHGLFAGGPVADVQNTIQGGVFQLRTNAWQTCGWFGSTGRIYALAVQGTNLFAGGRFAAAGGVPANNVARWDGAQWHPLGSGTDAEVFALASDGARLYVGGAFTNAGGVLSPRIACWDGANWSGLGSGFANGSVLALAWANGRLFAGGSFTNGGGQPARRIACWDGNAWQPLGDGVEGTNASVNATAVAGSNVYVGGRFTLAGGVPANNVARWDGAAWHALGTGETNGVLSSSTAVYALAVRDEVVYVGGRFTNAGGRAVWCLARFDGTNWSALGSGIRQWSGSTAAQVRALAWDEDSLWVAGLFPAVGNKAAAGLARWVEAPRVRLGAPRRLPGEGWQIGLRGVLGLRYRVETSEDLARWTLLTRGAANADEAVVLDSSTAAGRFYRVALEP
jgi:hypothetical protein